MTPRGPNGQTAGPFLRKNRNFAECAERPGIPPKTPPYAEMGPAYARSSAICHCSKPDRYQGHKDRTNGAASISQRRRMGSDIKRQVSEYDTSGNIMALRHLRTNCPGGPTGIWARRRNSRRESTWVTPTNATEASKFPGARVARHSPGNSTPGGSAAVGSPGRAADFLGNIAGSPREILPAKFPGCVWGWAGGSGNSERIFLGEGGPRTFTSFPPEGVSGAGKLDLCVDWHSARVF